jgi:predicted RNA-binding Zn-ribbon protein involved in translation (DUF1610 family)
MTQVIDTTSRTLEKARFEICPYCDIDIIIIDDVSGINCPSCGNYVAVNNDN